MIKYYKIVDTKETIRSVVSIKAPNPKEEIIAMTIDRPKRYFHEIDYKTFLTIKKTMFLPTHITLNGIQG